MNLRPHMITALNDMFLFENIMLNCHFAFLAPAKITLSRQIANYTNQYHSSWKYEPYIPEKINNQSIITRSNNLYLSLGTTFQFFSTKREYFPLHVEFNKGFFTYLDTKIMYREYGVTEWKSKRLYSRGSNISCTASYPITLVNKKGKRRKDRRSK